MTEHRVVCGDAGKKKAGGPPPPITEVNPTSAISPPTVDVHVGYEEDVFADARLRITWTNVPLPRLDRESHKTTLIRDGVKRLSTDSNPVDL